MARLFCSWWNSSSQTCAGQHPRTSLAGSMLRLQFVVSVLGPQIRPESGFASLGLHSSWTVLISNDFISGFDILSHGSGACLKLSEMQGCPGSPTQAELGQAGGVPIPPSPLFVLFLPGGFVALRMKFQ